MKRKSYSVEQIVAAVKQHELGTSAADIARKLGIAEQTFYRWKKQYGGLEPGQARELKQLREENAKLKQVVADLSLDKAMLTDIAKKSGEGATVSRSRGVLAQPLRHQRASSLSGRRTTAIGTVAHVAATATGRAEAAHQGAGGGSRPVRLQAHPRPAAARGLADQPQARSSPVLRARLAASLSAASSSCQRRSPAATQASCASIERGLEHGLHGRSAR
jgi:putative transposase